MKFKYLLTISLIEFLPSLLHSMNKFLKLFFMVETTCTRTFSFPIKIVFKKSGSLQIISTTSLKILSFLKSSLNFSSAFSSILNDGSSSNLFIHISFNFDFNNNFLVLFLCSSPWKIQYICLVNESSYRELYIFLISSEFEIELKKINNTKKFPSSGIMVLFTV